jgi:hypothetical protein
VDGEGQLEGELEGEEKEKGRGREGKRKRREEEEKGRGREGKDHVRGRSTYVQVDGTTNGFGIEIGRPCLGLDWEGNC